jgi:phage shock protein C
MFCTKCGVSLGEPEPNFCPGCGAQTHAGNASFQSSARPRILQRPREGRRFAGVCAGLADYFDFDVTIIRIAWVVAFFCYGTGLLAYIIASFVMPNEEYRPASSPVRP